ncbi:PucR family transcriptional regulator ligand-binding domain-containing protein [Enterococcus gallinarum]|nr:Regulator of polyketide synthase expression [Enterococcus sp. HSIEG1]MCU7700043.1 PucR family transcriptional regulator ligand-binding domain-containing protein [Enterococcus gallinarum]MCW3744683.1 PucR family transcriptional regulator ligand-binding domain-containing protein [Enterococcus gallinarum]
MQLKELIELPLFKNSKTLTGTIGLTNPVASVMVLEAIDIEKWSKKDQLILTSFYAFTDLSMDQLRVFLKRCSRLGSVG